MNIAKWQLLSLVEENEEVTTQRKRKITTAWVLRLYTVRERRFDIENCTFSGNRSPPHRLNIWLESRGVMCSARLIGISQT